MATPEVAGFLFLLEVGRWAKDELSQRWLHQRQAQSESEPEDIAALEEESPVLQEIWAEMTQTRSESDVKRILQLIKTNGGLILDYEESKAHARAQAVNVDGNDMLLRKRLQHFDDEIEAVRNEMRKHAKKLGIEITE